jgi:hypothetical protein
VSKCGNAALLAQRRMLAKQVIVMASINQRYSLENYISQKLWTSALKELAVAVSKLIAAIVNVMLCLKFCLHESKLAGDVVKFSASS